MDGIWNFDFLNHGNLDLLDDGILFGVMMMNSVNFVRNLDLDDFAVEKGKEKFFFVLLVSILTENSLAAMNGLEVKGYQYQEAD